MKTSDLQIGKWYSNGVEVLKVIGIDENSHGELGVRFADKRHHRFDLDFDIFIEVSEPTDDPFKIISDSHLKDHDSKYFEAKNRHKILCDRKSELYRQGKNKNMSVAYINQELETLRDILKQYKY